MLTLLLGSDWTVNRSEILNMIARDVKAKLGGRILMVPELISHDTERRLCAVAGDTTSRYAEVLSFTRLANRVSEAVGHAAPVCLDNGGRIVALASAARQLHSKLKAYAAVETKPEFLSGLLDAIDEFKRCCISPADLMRAAKETEGSLAQKLEELALLFETYDALCRQGRCDPRDQMTWLLGELEDSNFAAGKVFYIDGFPDFTRQNFAILLHLIRASEKVIISLNCDRPGSDLMSFEKAGQTAADLLREAKRMGIPSEIRYLSERTDKLSNVRKKLFQGNIEATVSALQTYCCESVYQECCSAADKIVELVLAGARYRDICIVCADMSQYQNTVELILKQTGIPSYISGTDDILEKPAIATVIAAIDAALSGFEQKDVLKYLKSMLSPLDMDTCDRIENYAIMWNIQGSGWQQNWTFHPNGLGQTWNDSYEQRLTMLNEARARAIDPLARLRDSFCEAKKMRDQVEAVYAFLEDISLSRRLRMLADKYEKLGDHRNAQILNQLWEILLSAIEQLYDVLGETSWEAENFTRLFKLLLSQYDVGTIPPVLDAVTVGPVNAMRCQQCKHLIVLGAQEGCLPAYSGSNSILSDYERTELRRIGVQLTGGAMEGIQAEFAEIYGVFCGAEESVSVSYAGGQPSHVFRRLSELSGGVISVENTMGSAMTNPLDAAAILLRTESAVMADKLGVQQQYEQLQSHKNHNLGYLNQNSVKDLYGETLLLSASQIDRQAECRMMYFLKYGLRVKERKPATIDPAEFGTYVHAVLEETAREIVAAGGFKNVSIEQAVAIAKKHSQAYAQERFSELDTERLKFLFQRNSCELELIVRELWQEMQTSQFDPIGFEVGFGEHEEIASIDVSGKNMAAFLRGYVDRVDQWKDKEKSYFRVVDYKTGKKDFDYCDVYNGYGLQMLLYLFALEQQGSKLLGEDSVPAGVQYFPARVPFVSADGIMTQEEAEKERIKLWKRKGLILCDETVLNAMENLDEPVRMPYSRKKDGTLSGDLAFSSQFSLLKTYVFALVARMVDEIASGCITPNPYTRGSSHDACAFCPYGMICHKESVEGRRNYKTMTSQRFWEDIEKEMKNHG